MESTPTSAALGYFDGVHLGHKEVIQAAISQSTGSRTLRYEPAVFTFKSRSPLPKLTESGGLTNLNITTDGLKHKLLQTLGVKHIYSYDFPKIKHLSPEDFVSEILVKKLNAKVVCCGYDFRFGEGGKADSNDLAHICERLGL